MNKNRIVNYKDAVGQLPAQMLGWPLYGDGIDNLGINGKPVVLPMPEFNGDELLMRIDAVSLCYTDVKEISQGSNHPRLTDRDLAQNPIIPGHEIAMTVVGVGKNLVDAYHVGQRFTMQPDVWVDGVSIPFCFGMDGGYRQYAAIGKAILAGDAGNYLIPVPDDMSYAAAAITEPWACVEAAYRMEYRTGIKMDGYVWMAGSAQTRTGFQMQGLFSDDHIPHTVFASNLPQKLLADLKEAADTYHFTLIEKEAEQIFASDDNLDDIILLDCDQTFTNRASEKLAKGGVLAILKENKTHDLFQVDLGRLHYDAIYYVGSSELEISAAYTSTKPRNELKPHGKVWILGAGGPMGRMHLQRAIESINGPEEIFASEVTDDRYQSLLQDFPELAQKHHKKLTILDPKTQVDAYQQYLQDVMERGGFDDIEIMITVAPVISEAVNYLADGGVVNLFAGLKRGVCTDVDAALMYGKKQVRFMGHSGSGLDDQKAVVQRTVNKQLKPELSVAAIGGVNQIADGIRAMQNWVYPGKIVIYPQVTDFPITGLDEFAEKNQEVFKIIQKEKCWTQEAEEIFLSKELS